MRAWVEVDLDALGRNFDLVRNEVGRGVDIIAVVKNDAYGHGLKVIVQTLDSKSVAAYAVLDLNEARAIRAESDKPVLIMGYLDVKEVVDAIEEGYILSVYDKEQLPAYERFAARLGRQLAVHLKVETGLNRLGVQPEEAIDFIVSQHLFPHLKLEAVYSHLSHAGNHVQSLKQLRILQELLTTVGQKVPILPVHLCSSYSLGNFKEGYFDAVRIGLALYGSDQILPGLEPILTCKSVLMQPKMIKAGEGVGYNHLFVASKNMTIGVVVIGYGDGLSQSFINKMSVLIQGQEVSVIGRISMNHLIVDLTGIEARRGEEVIIIGSQMNRHGQASTISVTDLAKRLSLSHHEIVTRLGCSVPRLYSRSGSRIISEPK